MKIKLAVLFGGKSVEHEISIISAIQTIASFDPEKYGVLPVYISKDNGFYVGEDVDDIEAYRDVGALLKKSTRVVFAAEEGRAVLARYPAKRLGNNIVDSVDVAFPVVHGANVEDGTLQGFLKMLNIPFVGCNVLSSAVGMDKYMMKAVLKDNDIPVLDCLRFNASDFDDLEELASCVEEGLAYPVVVKPINLGSSIGISKASNRGGLMDSLELAFEFSNRVLVEPAVQNMREINCAVIGDAKEAEASTCEEPINADEILSFQDKYLGSCPKGTGSKGMASTQRVIPAEIPDEIRKKIQALAVDAFKCLGCCGVARMDFLMDAQTNEIWLNEINTIPGSLSFYLWKAGGLSYSDLLDRLVALALKRQREEDSVVCSFESNVLSSSSLNYRKGAKLK